ncbi:hypothetical protein [Gemmatimonas aurantiaca]|uniref:hypothetical protein n=1 Tax=Gemmatimonas aurantiaca TaxID=173480 RepID=UPI00301D0311
MRRRHLFEIADQSWCPRVVRDGVTDYLRHAITVGNAYGPAVPHLAGLLHRTGRNDIVDLAAGGGGPWQSLLPALAAEGVAPTITLTDWHPNLEAFARAAHDMPGRVQGERRAVDARRVPADLRGVRTMFSALHHFEEDEIVAMLRDAEQAGEPFAALEATHRSVKALLITCLTPILVLLFTPAIRPFRWSRLLFTYLIPLIPLTVLWDGLVSCLRTYTPAELDDIAQRAGVQHTRYEWRAGESGGGPLPVTYLIGLTRSNAPART